MEILVESAEFCALHIDCPGGPAHWSADTILPDHGIYVVRQGAFRVRSQQLVRLLVIAAHGWCPLPDGGTPPVVAHAREAIVADDPAARSLLSLAALLGVSPYQLSRRFSASVGMSLTQYRNRVRVSRALSRLTAGERDLAGLAADLGFADQAHLTRAVKAAAGLPPGAVRAAAADRGPWPDPDLVGQESSSHLASLLRMLSSTG